MVERSCDTLTGLSEPDPIARRREVVDLRRHADDALIDEINVRRVVQNIDGTIDHLPAWVASELAYA
jgi:hypothetical protein